MASFATLYVLVALDLAASAAVGQESTSSFEWGASERIRFESKQDFNFDDSSQDYMLAQTRLHVYVKFVFKFLPVKALTHGGTPMRVCA